MTPAEILKQAEALETMALRMEVHNLLATIKRQSNKLAGSDLAMLKRYLEKIFQY